MHALFSELLIFKDSSIPLYQFDQLASYILCYYPGTLIETSVSNRDK